MLKVGVKVKGRVKVMLKVAQWSILGARLCQVQQRAKNSHYQSKVFVRVSSNRADAVDRLLIYYSFSDIIGCWHLLLLDQILI